MVSSRGTLRIRTRFCPRVSWVLSSGNVWSINRLTQRKNTRRTADAAQTLNLTRNSREMGWLTRFILLFWLSTETTSALNSFPRKFTVGEKHTTVTLTCQTDKDNIIWKHGTEEILDSEIEKLGGQDLTLINLQEDQIGNYTCWSGRDLEDYTYLLLDKSKEVTGFSINCTAETFSCSENIKCSCTSDKFTAFRLRNTRDSSDWVSQSVDGVFSLPHSTDSYSEESEQLQITGEAVSSCCYVKADYSFYLRDIVKPANPDISICTKENDGEQITEVEVKPPVSWPQPHSFFPLKHQIQYEIRDNGELKTKEWEEGSKIKFQGSIRKLRVRCRDLLLLSQWSEWTSWTNVSNRTSGNPTKGHKAPKKKKKRNKRKNCKNNRPRKHHKKCRKT